MVIPFNKIKVGRKYYLEYRGYRYTIEVTSIYDTCVYYKVIKRTSRECPYPWSRSIYLNVGETEFFMKNSYMHQRHFKEIKKKSTYNEDDGEYYV